MPPKTEDLPIEAKVKRLFMGNLAKRLDAGDTLDNDEYELPLEYEALGYTGVARIMGVGPGAIRHYWAADLARGFSQSLPAPDVLIKRVLTRTDDTEDVEMLPGWAEETIREWMPFRVGTGNHTTSDSPTGRRGNTNGRRGWRRDAPTTEDADVFAPS